MGGHFAQLVFHAVEAAVGGLAQLGRHLQAGGFHTLGQAIGQLVQALLHAFAGVASLDGLKTTIQGGERRAEGEQGFGRAGFGGFKALSQAGHDLVDQGGRIARADAGLVVQAIFQVSDGLAGAGLAFVKVTGDLAQGAFQRAQRFG